MLVARPLSCTCAIRQRGAVASSSAASSFTRRYQSSSSASTSKAVSQRLSGHPHLWLHATQDNSRCALSYLDTAPLNPDSPTIVGHVALSKDGNEAPTKSSLRKVTVTPRNFEENPDWRTMLHHILSSVYSLDAGLQTQAATRQTGHLHIIDERNLPALNRAGEPEDIIASVLCQDGKLVEEDGYEPGDAYRIVTTNGPTLLTESLAEKVVQGLEVARQIEQQMAEEGAQ